MADYLFADDYSGEDTSDNVSSTTDTSSSGGFQSEMVVAYDRPDVHYFSSLHSEVWHDVLDHACTVLACCR